MKHLLIVSALFSASALAQSNAANSNQTAIANSTWNSIDISHSTYKIGDDEFPFEPSGFEFSGSYLLNESVFVAGSYSKRSDDIGFDFYDESFVMEVEMTNTILGLGYRAPLQSGFDGYATISYVDLSVDVSLKNAPSYLDDSDSSEGDSSDGYIAAAGIKYLAVQNLEIYAQAGLWVPFDTDDDVEAESETEFKFGAKYRFYDNFAASFSYSKMEDTDIINFGVTYYLN